MILWPVVVVEVAMLMFVQQQEAQLLPSKFDLTIFLQVNSNSTFLSKKTGYHQFEMNGGVA